MKGYGIKKETWRVSKHFHLFIFRFSSRIFYDKSQTKGLITELSSQKMSLSEEKQQNMHSSGH